MRARLGTTFQSLSVRNYRLFATGQLVKLIGVWVMITAQDWLVLQLSGNSATALGVVTALQFIPVLLLTLYAGKLADRYDKRRILIVANGAWAGLAMVLGALVFTGVVQLWHVFVFATLLGIANAVETPVRQAFVSELVGTPLLPNALSLSAATFNTARITGPAVAGLAIAWFGVGPVFQLSTILALSPMVSLIRIRPAELYREALPPVAERDAATITDGLRYVRGRPDLILPIVLMAVVGMLGFNFPVTLAALAKVTFASGAASFGLFTTALAGGALAGALAGSGRRGRPSAYVVLAAAVAFGALETVAGFAPTFWLVAALLVPTGFFMVYFAQAANQRVQLGTDAAYRGRVMSLYVLVFLGTTPIGAPFIGWWAEHFGAPSSVWLGGVLSLLAGVVALVWQLRRRRERLRLVVLPTPRLYVVPSVVDNPEVARAA
ncbi:MFS transporter [Rhizomonospora bruguierae]|uniref:MFS transporter n=1 Tax=Rhizomonospora bruguierae TaxID=1581705 RepID=UPI001BCB5705|nr:MFS transporter [Micromonospora sp. NBRC 107566]